MAARKKPKHRGRATTRANAIRLIRAAVSAGKADRFTVAELFPTQVTIYVGTSGGGPLELAIAAGLVDRVPDGRRWFYRLTPAGIKAARRGRIPVVAGSRWVQDAPEVGVTVCSVSRAPDNYSDFVAADWR